MEKRLLEKVEDLDDLEYAIDCIEDDELRAEAETYIDMFKNNTPKEIAQMIIEDLF